MLDKFEPVSILSEGHASELVTYKGVMVSKQHAEKDMFKINLLCMLAPNDFKYDRYYDNDCNSEDEEELISEETLDNSEDVIVAPNKFSTLKNKTIPINATINPSITNITWNIPCNFFSSSV